MRWRPESIGEIIRRIGVPAGSGGAGLLGGFALAHNAVAAVVTALGLACAVSVAKIFESIYRQRAKILEVKGKAKADCIKAASEAAALLKRTDVQADLLRSGLEPGKTEPAGEMLRYLAINPDLPEDRRLNDEALAKLLTPPRTKNGGAQPDSGSPGVVRPIRLMCPR